MGAMVHKNQFLKSLAAMAILTALVVGFHLLFLQPVQADRPADLSKGARLASGHLRPQQQSTAAPDCQKCDINGDGVVNVQDVTLLGSHFGETGAPGWIPEDVNQDGMVNVLDITLVNACLGQVVPTGPAGTPTLTITPSPTFTGTATGTPTPTATYTITGTISPSPSSTPTPTGTSTGSPTPTPAVSMAISPASIAASGIGSAVNFDILLSSDSPTRGAQAAISFNPAVLSCSSVTEGTFYSAWATANGGSTIMLPSRPAIDNVNGKIATASISILGAAATPDPQGRIGGVTGSGVFLSVTCQAVGNGVSAIILSDVQVGDDRSQFSVSYPVTLLAGNVFVGVPTYTPTVTPTFTHTPTGTLPTQTPTRTPTGTGTITPTPTGTGTPTPSPTGTLTVTPTVGTLNLVPAATIVAPNQSFTVEMDLNTTQPSWAIQFGATFDKAILHCDSIERGNFYTDWADQNSYTWLEIPPPTCNNATGKIVLGSTSIVGVEQNGRGPSGSGKVYTLHFTALAAGTSPITLTDVIVSDAYLVNKDGHNTTSPLAISVSGANVTVSNSAPTPTHTPTPTKTPTPTNGTPTSTHTPTPTKTPTPTNATPTPTSTPTKTPSSTPNNTPTKAPTATGIPANASLQISPAIKQIDAPGSTFTLDILVTIDKPSLNAQTTVLFNKAILECVKIEKGAFYNDWAISRGVTTMFVPDAKCDNANGTTSPISLSIFNAPTPTPVGSDPPSQLIGDAPTGNGVFVTITFKAKAVGSSDIKLVNSLIGDNNRQYTHYYATSNYKGVVYIGVTPNPSQQAEITTPTASTSQTPSAGTTASVSLTPGSGTPSSSGTPDVLRFGETIFPPTRTSTPSQPGNTSGNSAPTTSGPPKATNLLDKMDAQGVLNDEVEINSPDGLAIIRLFKGVQALSKDNRRLQNITVAKIDQLDKVVNGFTTLDLGYEFGPEGASFDPPITITFHYDPARLPKGVDEKNLVVTTYDPAKKSWSALKSQVDSKAKTVSAEVSHFSMYALMAKNPLVSQIGLIAGIILLELLMGAGIAFYVLRRRRLAQSSVSEPVIYLLPSPRQAQGIEKIPGTSPENDQPNSENEPEGHSQISVK